MSIDLNSVDFQFATGTSDAQRLEIWRSLVLRYGGAGGGAGVENPALSIQPDGLYAVVLRPDQDPEQAAQEIRTTPGIEPMSVQVVAAT